MLEHEGTALLLVDPERLDGRRPRADHIPHCLVGFVGNPNRCQLVDSQQLGQSRGVVTVSLDPVAGSPADQRRRHDHASVAQRHDHSVQTVASGAGLVAELNPITLRRNPQDDPAHIVQRGLHLTEISDVASTSAFGHRDRIVCLGDIDSDESYSLGLHGSSSCNEDRLRLPEQPCRRSVGRAASTQRTYGSHPPPAV